MVSGAAVLHGLGVGGVPRVGHHGAPLVHRGLTGVRGIGQGQRAHEVTPAYDAILLPRLVA